MQRTGVSAVTAYTAHREWATRPPDERFASVSALYEAARVRRARTEERTIETHQVRTAAATDDDLLMREASGHTAPLTHWSFEQLAAIAGAPPKYSGHCPRRSRQARSTWVSSGTTAKGINSSPIERRRGRSTRSPRRGTHGFTTTTWRRGCSTSWPIIRRGTCRSAIRTAYTAPSSCRRAPTWETGTCSPRRREP
jgi:hypothetical protein